MLLFPLPPVLQFFSHLFPVFAIVVSLLLCVFWLADYLNRNPGWAAALSTWGVLPGSWWLSIRMSDIGDASCCSLPCTWGGRNRAMLIYSSGPVFCWVEILDIKWTVASEVVLWGMYSRNSYFLMSFWVCFVFEDLVRIVIELCVVGSKLVVYERFIIANH